MAGKEVWEIGCLLINHFMVLLLLVVLDLVTVVEQIFAIVVEIIVLQVKYLVLQVKFHIFLEQIIMDPQ
jgi:hypothetical protein